MVDSSGRGRRAARLGADIELFYFAYRAFTAGADALLAARGLGRVHHRVLYFVGRNPDLAVHELLQILAVSKQALHAPLRALLAAGLVQARPDARDRRLRRLRLSPAGRRLEARLSATQSRQLERVFAGAGGAARLHWRRVMRAISGTTAAAG